MAETTQTCEYDGCTQLADVEAGSPVFQVDDHGNRTGTFYPLTRHLCQAHYEVEKQTYSDLEILVEGE